MSNKTTKLIIKEQNCTGCLICQLYCSYLHNHEFNPSKSFISVDLDGLLPRISFLEGCKKCGQCAKYCLYDALELGGVVEE